MFPIESSGKSTVQPSPNAALIRIPAFLRCFAQFTVRTPVVIDASIVATVTGRSGLQCGSGWELFGTTDGQD